MIVLSPSRIVRQQESQWLPGKHTLIDSCNLVREGIDQRSVNRQHRVEEVRQTDVLRLGDQA